MEDQKPNESQEITGTTSPDSDPSNVDEQPSFRERPVLRPLSDAEGKKEPKIEFFSRQNPHPSKNKPHSKEQREMPAQKRTDADAEPAEVKNGSDDLKQTLPAKERNTSPGQNGSVVGMVDRSKLKAILDQLRQRKTITNDKGDEIDFTDDLKTSLVTDVQSAYPVLASALRNIYETGKFLYEVWERQRKNRLWTEFLNTVGLKKSATNNYIRVYKRYGDRLDECGYLGVSKLQVIARLKEPFAFLEAHKEEVEKGDVRSVTKLVLAEADAKRTKRSKREAQAVEVGSYRLKLAANGRFLTIQNLNKDMQNKLVKYLTKLLSKEK